MTPEWIPTIVAAVAALGGAAMGAVINQVGASRQAKISWQREKESRAADQVRADRYRLFDKRQEAYVNLYSTIGTMRRALVILTRNTESEECRKEALDARNRYWRAYAVVRLIGSDQVFTVANGFLRLFDRWLDAQEFDDETFRLRLGAFTDAVRHELGASGRASDSPGGGDQPGET